MPPSREKSAYGSFQNAEGNIDAANVGRSPSALLYDERANGIANLLENLFAVANEIGSTDVNKI